MSRISVFFIIFTCFTQAKGSLLKSRFSGSIGMIGASFAENESTLVGSKQVAKTGTESITGIDFTYESPLDLSKSYFIRGTLPLIANGEANYIYAGTGLNYYFNTTNSDLSSINDGVQLDISTKLKYYAGGQIGVSYFLYTTETSKKTDTMLLLGAQGGVLYQYWKNWGLKAEATIARGTGNQASATFFQIFFGTTFNLDG